MAKTDSPTSAVGRGAGAAPVRAPRSAAESEQIRAALTARHQELRAEYDQTVTELNELQRDRLIDSAGDDQADTGTKMVHLGRNTRSTILSKGISAAHGQNTYRGLVKVLKGAERARNFTRCDSLLIGDRCGAHTFPYVEVKNPSAQVEHEATTSRIGEDQLFYCRQRGISADDAVSMIVNGFCREVFKELPMEFAVEAHKLLSLSLEGAVG